MTIAVLANEFLKDEMQQKISDSSTHVVWMKSIDELITIKNSEAYFDLEFVNEEERIKMLQELLPKPVFINSVVDVIPKIDNSFIRLNTWRGFLQRKICEVSVANEEQQKNAEKIFAKLNWDYRFVPDVPGFISARIVAMIINEAYFTLQEGVSTKDEIDIAMKLGTNYPYGPFEWAEKISLKNIYDLLSELSKTDSRYIVSPALKNDLIENGNKK